MGPNVRKDYQQMTLAGKELSDTFCQIVLNSDIWPVFDRFNTLFFLFYLTLKAPITTAADDKF